MANDAPPSITRINPPELGTPPGYSQVVGVSAGRIIFIAGQTRSIATGTSSARMILPRRQLRYFATSPSRWKRPTAPQPTWLIYLTDMDNLSRYREARNRFFASVTPAAASAVTLVEVTKLYGLDFMIEIEAIAAAS